MSSILLMPEVGDLTVRANGDRFVVTAANYETGMFWFVRAKAGDGDPGPTTDQLTQLGVATDDQLRAECSRRGIVAHRLEDWREMADNIASTNGSVAREAAEMAAAEALRKWGLNPEAVREYDSLEDAMYAMGYVLDRCYERGPGIAATRPADDGHYVDPLDLLADDAP